MSKQDYYSQKLSNENPMIRKTDKKTEMETKKMKNVTKTCKDK